MHAKYLFNAEAAARGRAGRGAAGAPRGRGGDGGPAARGRGGRGGPAERGRGRGARGRGGAGAERGGRGAREKASLTLLQMHSKKVPGGECLLGVECVSSG